MGMIRSVWPWIAGVTIGCAAIAALLLPFPPTRPETWPGAPAPLAAEVAALTKAVGDARVAVRTYRNTQALQRWSAAAATGETTLVRMDAGVPAPVAREVRAIIGDQWQSLGTAASAASAEVYVYVDSTTIPRAAGAQAARQAPEARGLVDVTFALPAATDGKRCVTLIRLRGTSPANVAALRARSAIGVCGFFAAFGTPGVGVGAWLVASRYRFARQSDWSVARAPATDGSGRYTLSAPAARCLTGMTAACGEALELEGGAGARRATERLDWVLDPSMPEGWRGGIARSTLGDAEGALLADAVRSLGPDRFRRFWHSGSPAAAAFAVANGIGLEAWTQQWLTRTYGAPPARPYVAARDLIWLGVALAVALLVAATPRHRVLSGRWFTERG